MRDYEDEYLDEYEEDGYYDEDGVAGEEYEQEEEPELTQEQLEYLELRRKLKESYRKKIKKETGSTASKSLDRNRKDNFGSFFGPSQPVIAPRVIQESKSLLENKHLTARILNRSDRIEKVISKTSAGIRPRPSILPKVDPVKVKVQQLKDTRDYSFLLSDDAQPSAPRKEPPLLRKVSSPSPDSRSTQGIPEKSRQPLSNGIRKVSGSSRPIPSTSRQVPNSSRQVPSSSRQVLRGPDERKAVSLNGKLQQARPRDTKVDFTIGQNSNSHDIRKQSNVRPVLNRLAESNKHPASSSRAGLERQAGLKNVPSKMDSGYVNKNAPVTKSSIPSVQRSIPPPRSYLQAAKLPLVQKKVPHDPYKAKIVVKQPATSGNPQISRSISKPINKPVKPISSQDRPKKRPLSRYPDDEDDNGFDYRSVIRNMFKYNPNKFQNDDDDTDDMEAGFDEIAEEERRSALIARKEDEIEQRLIEEEERRERMKKEAKRRKLSQR